MMAENPVPEIEAALDQATGPIEGRKKKFDPLYRVMTSEKILVSKKYGDLWKSRLGQARQARSKFEDAWREAIRYYNHDQTEYRELDTPNRSGNRAAAKRMNDEWSETENIVFANASTMMPILYSKNPTVEFTHMNHEGDARASQLEDLVNGLAAMRIIPGLNLKRKSRRGILLALLTNQAYMKVNYVFKDDAAETFIDQINSLAEELEKAKTPKKIEEVEGKLQALEISVDASLPQGPTVDLISPFRLFVDPDCQELDLTDANWIIEEDYLLTDFLNARYGDKKKDGEVKSVYKPTHVLRAGSDGTDVDKEVEMFTLLDGGTEGQEYGYSDEHSFNRAKHTKVHYVWDRTTKRVLIYADNDWTWPVWVWDDPLHLQGFFPYFCLAFHDNPAGRNAKGEVTYYLDQQDAINEINDEERRARLWVRRNIIYNSNYIDRDVAEAFLKGPDQSALGVALPEGVKMQEVFDSIAPPAMNFPQLFDTSRKLEAINRLSSVSDVMTGAQFKTNTTNQAIARYDSAAQVRSGEKQDIIEDWIGQILWAVAQLCLQYMNEETVQEILGVESAGWQTIGAEQIRSQYKMHVTAGSAQKPTSAAKKKEAVEVGQVLGQFAGGAPQVVEVMLRLFEQAFDEIVMKDEDWVALRESIFAAQNQAGAGPGGAQGAPSPGGQAPGGQAPPPNGQAPAQGGEQQMQEIIAQLPPEAQAALQTAVEQGVPPAEALERIMQRLQQ
jgi:hypothetical protein